MDFNDLATAQSHGNGAEINILSPVDGKPTDVYITIMGIDSKEWRAAKKAQTSQIITARADGKMEDLDYDRMDAEALAKITLGWKGIAKEGKEYKFSYENALSLYLDAPAVVSQLIEFVSNRENFIKG